MTQSRGRYSLVGSDLSSLVRELNFMLSHVSDRLDQIESLRGTFEIFGDASVTGVITSGTLTTDDITAATLTISGASTLDALTAGASTLASLTVTGTTTLASVTVTGATVLADVDVARLLVGDVLTVPGSLPASSGDAPEAVSLDSDLVVTGRVMAGSGLEVAGGAYVGDDLRAAAIYASKISMRDSAQILLGDSNDFLIYYDGSNSYISDQGAGGVKVLTSSFSVRTGNDDEDLIVATAHGTVALYYDNTKQLETRSFGVTVYNDLEIDGAINHDGTTVGFYAVAPVTRPSAFTQTYSTATRTHASPTAAALTDSSGGTADQTVAAVSGSGADIDINNNFAELADEVNKLITDLANTKQVVNQMLDDLQANGLLQ